ncbi:MAG: T9SS type A sorting domain-containing protein [Flavobacteriales bacterium]|nr:T9SS type A sorting domain-containing protein [Flavobacteriales bacterium]
MKHVYLILSSFFASTFLFAQGYVSDRVYMGPGYMNEVFYSLSNDSVGAAPVKNWDLAFSVYGGTSDEFLSILANHVNGVNIYLNNTPANQTNFDNFDTTGYQSWQQLFNTDTSWWYGAFNREPYAHPNYSWGTYTTNGTMSGRFIYLVELKTTGQPTLYKKLWIKKKSSISGSVSIEFTYANLDGSDLQALTFNDVQNTYSGKRYMFFSLRNNQALDREPARDAWDITFTRYTAYLSMGGPPTYYPVTGVLLNQGVQAARVGGVLPGDAQEGMAPYRTAMNTVGHDWKSFNNSTMQWSIVDTLSYFIKDLNGAIWHLYFTGFGGQATGMCEFDKKLLSSAGLGQEDYQNLILYPNPAKETTYLITEFSKPGVARMDILNMHGQFVYSQNITVGQNFTATPVDLGRLSSGLYLVRLTQANVVFQARLMVER